MHKKFLPLYDTPDVPFCGEEKQEYIYLTFAEKAVIIIVEYFCIFTKKNE